MRRRSLVIIAAAVAGLVVAGLGVSGALPGSPQPVFDGMTPVRILDTRDGTGAPKGPLGAGATLTIAVAGLNGIPANATSVVMNVTAVAATQVTHLTVWPTGQPRPNASSLNPSNGNATPNLVTTAIGAGGHVSIFNNSGNVHVLADVVGYYRDHNHDDRYYTESEVDGMLASRDSTVSSLGATVSSLEADAEHLTVLDSDSVNTPDLARNWWAPPDPNVASPPMMEAFALASTTAPTQVRIHLTGAVCDNAPPNHITYSVVLDGVALPSQAVFGTNPPTPDGAGIITVVIEAVVPDGTSAGLHTVKVGASAPAPGFQCQMHIGSADVQLLG